METFNKNWLAILLIAVIFGTLGFLVGRVTAHGPHHGMKKQKKERIHINKEIAGDSLEVKVEISGDGNIETTMKTDTIVKDGKKIIIQEVKKVKK